MDIDIAREFIRANSHAVLVTYRGDGRAQTSPVVCAVDDAGRVVVSATQDRAKVLNLRRDPRVAICAFTAGFYGPWAQVEGDAEIVDLPEAMDGLVAYYRQLSGEHPDWDDYRAAMRRDRRVLIRLDIRRAAGVPPR